MRSRNLTAEQFDAQLRAGVQARAQKLGLDSSQYASAMKTVGGLVRLCSSMPESDYAGSLDQFGIPHLVKYQEADIKTAFRPVFSVGFRRIGISPDFSFATIFANTGIFSKNDGMG